MTQAAEDKVEELISTIEELVNTAQALSYEHDLDIELTFDVERWESSWENSSC